MCLVAPYAVSHCFALPGASYLFLVRARAQAIAVMAESGRAGIREVVAASAKGYAGPFLKRLLAGAAKKKGLERATCLR